MSEFAKAWCVNKLTICSVFYHFVSFKSYSYILNTKHVLFMSKHILLLVEEHYHEVELCLFLKLLSSIKDLVFKT